MHRPLALILSLSFTLPAAAVEVQTSAGLLAITPVASGLTEPWGLAFLPGGEFLVTERDGRLLLFRDGQAVPVTGLPDVEADGQGGLLDVMVPRDFATSRAVWLSYSASVPGGSATALGKGVLSEDGTTLTGFRMLWQGDGMRGGRHFGSRIVEAPDGNIFLTTGDRGTGPDGLQAQDGMRTEGKVIHLTAEGAPVALPGLAPGVHSLGHRNAQGAALDADGALWLVEHGAQGGDEVNRVRPGRNYGWPVISYGSNYNGDKIGTGTAQDGMEQPAHFWDPSIAPSGLMIYAGAMFPEWQGDIFTGSLKFDMIARLDPDAGFAEERISAPETGRVRDIRQAPDGSIWFLSVTDGAVYRLARP